MEQNLVFIPDVTIGKSDWAVKVTVTEEMPTLIGYQRGTPYKRYILTDEKGNTILAIAYDSVIPAMMRMLHLHGVYIISNANVVKSSAPCNSSPNILNWVLQRRTMIRPLRGGVPTLQYFLQNIIPLNRVASALDKPQETVDVMAIVIKGHPTKTVTTRFGDSAVQRFTIVDESRTPLVLTLWDQMVGHFGPPMTDAASSYSVVVAKRLKVQTYDGITLSTTNGTSITFDVPVERATLLKLWFDCLDQADVQSMLKGYSIGFAKDLVDCGIVRKYTIGQINSNEQCGDFWVRAFLELPAGEQDMYYIGCSSCSKRVAALVAGCEFHCLSCEKDVVSSFCPWITIDVHDHSGRLTVGAVDNVAEQILNCTHSELMEAFKQRVHVKLEHIRAEMKDKMYLVLLRRTYNTSATPKRLLLVGYYDDTVEPNDDVPCHPSKSSVESSVECVQLVSKCFGTPGSKEPTTDKLLPSGAQLVSECFGTPGTKEPTTDKLLPSRGPKTNLEVSPLKRQLDSIALAPGTPMKKALFSATESSTSSTHTPENLDA